MAPFPGNAWNRRRPGDDGRDAFVYFDNDIKGAAPADAERLKARLAPRAAA